MHPRGVSRNYSHESVLRSAGVAEGVAGGGVGGGCDDEEEAPPAARERPSTVDFERFLMASLGGMMAQFGGGGGEGMGGLMMPGGGHFSPSDMPFLQFHGSGGGLIPSPKHCMHCRGCPGSCACPFSCPPCHPRASCSSFPNPAATQRAYDTARRLARQPGRPSTTSTTTTSATAASMGDTVDSRTDRYAMSARASGYAHCVCCLGGPALCSCVIGCPRTVKTKCTPQSTAPTRASSSSLLGGGERLRLSMVSRDAGVSWAMPSLAPGARRVPVVSATSSSSNSAAVPPPSPPATATSTSIKAVKGKGKGKGKGNLAAPLIAPLVSKVTKTKVKAGAAAAAASAAAAAVTVAASPPLPPPTASKRRRSAVEQPTETRDDAATAKEPKESVSKKRRK